MNNRPNRSPSIARWLLAAIGIGLVVGISVFAIFFFGVFKSGGGSVPTGSATSTPSTGNGSPLPGGGGNGSILRVQGNRLVDNAGQAVVLRGAQIESAFNVVHLTASEQTATDNLKNSTFTVMHSQWHMNVLRLPICDYIWAKDPAGYITKLTGVVSQANQAGLYVVMDLHSDARCGAPGGSPDLQMPLPHTIPFWQAVAAAFKNYPMVIFDAYNEPHLAGDDWPSWLNGGSKNGNTYVGMQQIVDTIRQQGAKQPIVVESLVNEKGLSTIGNNLVNDPNIIYSWHHYFKQTAERTQADWDRLFGTFSNSHPVLIGEWAFLPNANHPTFCAGLDTNAATQLVQSFLAYMQQHNVNWTVWNFEPTHMIVDYNTYTPTTLNTQWSCGQKSTNAGDGELVKQYLMQAPA